MSRWILGIALVAAAAAGLFARFHGLGQRPLAVDEYYFANSVARIVETGLPALPGGGYYTHGLLSQYAISFWVLLFGDTGFALRLAPVLFNLATCGLLVVYARRFLGPTLALCAGALLLVSSWEIEFARFARMYAQLQFMTLLYFWCLDRVFFEGRGWRYLPHVAAVLATFTHPIGVLFFPLLMLPVVLPARSEHGLGGVGERIRYAAATAAVTLVTAFLARFDFRNLGVGDAFPADFTAASTPVLRTPESPFLTFGAVGDHSLLPLALFAGLLLLVPLLVGLGRARGTGGAGSVGAAEIFCGLTLVSASFHNFLLAGVFGAILVARYPVRLQASSALRIALGLAVALCCLWAGLALVAGDAWQVFGGFGLGALRRAFFGWPNLYLPVVLPWSRELPWLAAGIGVACAFQWLRALRLPLAELLRNPAVQLLYFFVAFGILNSLYQSTRYSFFLYPLAIVVLFQGVAALAQALLGDSERSEVAAALTGAIFFALAGDFSPSHIAQVAGPEASTRTGPFADRVATWYLRADYRALAEAIASHSDSQARIVVAGIPPVSYSLPEAHSVYYGRADPRFVNVSREAGTRELWSQQRLLSTRQELLGYSAGASRVLLGRYVADPSVEDPPVEDPDGLDPEAVWGDAITALRRAYVTPDGRLELVVIELAAEPSPTR